MSDLMATIERLAADPGTDRDGAAVEVRRAADGDRALLEDARRRFQRRIRRRSDDHAAQRALRLVSGALDGLDRHVHYTYFNNEAYS